MTSVWETAVSIRAAEASVGISEGEKLSDTIREVAVGWFSDASEEGMAVPIPKASIEEVGELGRSSVEVAPAKFAMLLDKSSIADILESMASVVVGDEMTSLENAVLRVIASVSVLATLEILVAPSGSEPKPRLIDTLAVGVTFMVSSDHVGDGGGI
jgi:hypothetical protein